MYSDKPMTYAQERDARVQRFGYKDVDDAITKLVAQGKHNPFIGKVVDLTTCAVQYRIKKMGLQSAHGKGGPNYKGGFEKRKKLAVELGYSDLGTMYRTLYYGENKNLREIGKVVGFSGSNVSLDFKRLGIPRMKQWEKYKQRKMNGLI